MQVGRRTPPVPERDDHVALDALRPLRLGERQFTCGNPIGPVGEHGQGPLGVETADVAGHEELRLPRHQPPLPGFNRVLESTQFPRNCPRARRAERVTRAASADLDDIEPLALALDIRQRKFALRWRIEERPPVHRRVVLRCFLFTRCQNGGEVEHAPRPRRHFRRVDEFETAHPHAVVRLRKIGNDVAPAIVGDDNLGKFGRKLGRLRDHPDAGLGSIGPGDHAAEVTLKDADRGVALLGDRRLRYSAQGRGQGQRRYR